MVGRDISCDEACETQDHESIHVVLGGGRPRGRACDGCAGNGAPSSPVTGRVRGAATSERGKGERPTAFFYGWCHLSRGSVGPGRGAGFGLASIVSGNPRAGYGREVGREGAYTFERNR